MALQKWQVDLYEKGYAIIPDVLTPDECLSLENGFWNFWRRLSGGLLMKEDSQTWRTMFDFFPMHGMLSQHFSIGHMQEIWNVRSHERVKSVFATIWGTEDLVVSFDGASTSLAPEVTGRGWHRKDWLHLDQSPHRSDFECVQAWVTADDVGPGDGTLMVREGSHKLHAEFAKQFGLNNDKNYRSDWLKLTPEQDQWYEDKGCKKIAVECPKGSMVLWDSRTVHAGRSPVKGRATPRNRFVAYVCMMPANRLKPIERNKKQRACLEGRLTNHWAASRVKLFPKYPRTYGTPLPVIPDFEPPHFTNEQARLAGWLNPEVCPLTIANREERLRGIELALREMDMKKAKKRKRNPSP
mmetsp:Transcript_13445/g.32417  ORF Transcript_13445/g.32417 Transcript_13445/m.32417 type:complete len:354 (+) Transcript_13445:29-1090(+)|eukprot:CAMPEP_0113622464 /NCGR_PEP_ID=MMETSP0017_2-20120614/11512_1 /TAXON_ID=2856 /ORGANISM="Cylindrotheca closterium" /LENGTH=353 /DNA_ID=CAMNT_0000532297 /DNA_START=18 /DNA_END=1079 /DNA_ORIENTATION=+ /assembly_acc=CAM_ASM_000147